MDNIKLEQDEEEVLDAFEAEEFVSALDDERRDYIAKAAEESLREG